MFSDTDGVLSLAFSAARDAVCGQMRVRTGDVTRDAVFSPNGASPRAVTVTRQVTLLLLRDTFGCSFGEIARKTGISERRVKSNVSNARWCAANDPVFGDVCDAARYVLSDYGERAE